MDVIGKLNKVIRVFSEMKLKYLFYGSYVRVEKGSQLLVEKNCRIKKSRIYITGSSTLHLSTNVSLKESNIVLSNSSLFELADFVTLDGVKSMIDGQVRIGAYSILSKGNAPRNLELIVSKGNVAIENNCFIRCYRILVRFEGRLTVGAYTNVNEGSEIRVDEQVAIGSYNQISFNCMIWDTNTHNMYAAVKRQELTRAKFPNFGYEYERPKTNPITIGDDCWLGREATVLKGSKIGNCCVIGYRTTVVGKTYPMNTTIVSAVQNTTFKNKI